MPYMKEVGGPDREECLNVVEDRIHSAPLSTIT